MKKFIILLACIVLSLLFSAYTYADYLEVSRSAKIKTEPESNATLIERVSTGTTLRLLDTLQTNGYYYVESPISGAAGWVYRTLVRRYPGDLPGERRDLTAIDPLADPTLQLTEDQREFARRHLRLGKPQAVYERVREGYVVGQDARLKIPLWVQYALTREDRTGTVERSDDFREDTSMPPVARSRLNDYSGSGYDRGHMAPANDMRRSEQVMSESFLLSNMAPQVGAGFNGGIWRSLEMAINGWVDQRGTLTIITGPIFSVQNDSVSYHVIGDNHVAVPSHFYKIVVDANNPDQVQALAFIMANTSLTGHHYREYLRSIDEIETLTGIDFLRSLPDNIEDAVEAETATQVW